MSFGRLEKPTTNQPISDINVTPLVDVMLVLLVIFIIASPLMSSRLQMDLPKVGGVTEVVEGEELAVSVGLSAQGQFFWAEEAVSAEQLQERLRAAAARDPDTEVHVRADENASYGQVARLMAMAQQAGLTRLGFVGDPSASEHSGPVTAPPAPGVR